MSWLLSDGKKLTTFIFLVGTFSIFHSSSVCVEIRKEVLKAVLLTLQKGLCKVNGKRINLCLSLPLIL